MAGNAKIIQFARLIQAAKLAKVNIATNYAEASMCLDGLSINNGDTVTVDDFPKLVDLFTLMRQKAWRSNFLEMPRLRRSGHTVISAQRYLTFPHYESANALPAVPSNRTPKDFHLPRWRIDMALKYVGETSFATSSTLRTSNEIIIDSITIWAYVDRKTHRKFQIPAWFRSQHPLSNISSKPDRIKPIWPDWSRFASVQTQVISEEQIDHFGHTNHSNYASYSVESLRRTLGLGRHSSRGCVWRVKRVDMVFKGESEAGDRLHVGTIAVPSEKNDDARRWLCQIRNCATERGIAQVQYDIAKLSTFKAAL